MENLIETKNLTKCYGQSTVVDDVSIKVEKGKIYALLGRNGAGKTTLMKMLLKLIKASSGEVCMIGLKEEEIGSIIETPGFYENLTAHENLSLIQRLRGLKGKKGEEALLKALTLVGLQHEQRKPFSDYSLGMKQRLGIAAALMHDPKLLILDEPINGLDPIGISEMRALLAALCREQGTTILISSHVLTEIEQIADVIGVMHEGRLIEEVLMTDLRGRSRQWVEMEVCNASKAIAILKENGIIVKNMTHHQESLEGYFSDLIGGGGIA